MTEVALSNGIIGEKIRGLAAESDLSGFHDVGPMTELKSHPSILFNEKYARFF